MLKKTLFTALILVVFAASGIIGYMVYCDIRYPLKYQEEVAVFSEKYGLEASLINSIINAESRFDANAQSQSGAIGLMQLMPATALWISDRIGIEDFVFEDLFKPAVNIEMGAYYFKYLFDKFEDTDLALAAYNAGEGNVGKWLLSEQYSAGGRLVNIPFKETRDYIVRVNKFNRVYQKRTVRQKESL